MLLANSCVTQSAAQLPVALSARACLRVLEAAQLQVDSEMDGTPEETAGYS